MNQQHLHDDDPPTLVNEAQQQHVERSNETVVDCTLAYIRALTAPPINPPSLASLKDEVLAPSSWNLCLPVDTSDVITCKYWSSQKRTKLFKEMLDWNDTSNKSQHHHDHHHRQVVKLQPFFNLSSTPSLFSMPPWKEVATCIQQLLCRRVGCKHGGSYMALTCFGQCIFLATGLGYIEQEIWAMHLNPTYYCIRCHYDANRQKLLWGYHITASDEGKDPRKIFSPLMEISTITSNNVNWRLQVCKVMINVTRILNSLIDYGIPLTCKPVKRCIHGNCIEKTYTTSENIGGIPNVTVESMIEDYHKLIAHKVPHTDKLLSVHEGRIKRGNDHTTGSTKKSCITCSFGPIGRSYMPIDLEELLEALVCVAETLVAIHSFGLMHRDIRWANIFHAFRQEEEEEEEEENRNEKEVFFSHEWFLFDFEYAATSPQPSFGKYTLTSSNHAPEMFTANNAEVHTTAVDIWALGYLIQTANVDIPMSHAADLENLRKECMEKDPTKRPKATRCWETSTTLKARERSKEKDIPVPIHLLQQKKLS